MKRSKVRQPSVPERLSEQIRRCIVESGITRYRISKETGVSQGTLSQFVNGRRGLSVEAMDLIGVFLGLSVVAVESGRVQGRSPKGKRNGRASTGG
jgi:transcriptional regulator with XRE-family HTH domain